MPLRMIPDWKPMAVPKSVAIESGRRSETAFGKWLLPGMPMGTCLRRQDAKVGPAFRRGEQNLERARGCRRARYRLCQMLDGASTACIKLLFHSPVTLKWAAAPSSKASIRL